MAQFSISPGVTTQEQDQTLTVPAEPTSVGALSGVFKWGPAMQPTMIGSVSQLLATFGKPTNEFNLETWYSAYNFLGYSSALYVCRGMDANGVNSVANTGASSPVQVNSADAYEALQSYPQNAPFMAKYPGAMGNSLRVSVCPSAAAYSSSTPAPTDANNTVQFSFSGGSSSGVLTVTNTGSANANTAAQTDAAAILAAISVNDWLLVGNTSIGEQYVQVTGVGSPVNSSNGVATAQLTLSSKLFLTATATSTSVTRFWEFYSHVQGAPGTSDYVSTRGGSGDEMHVVVVDEDGMFSGVPNSILEVYSGLSRASDAQSETGGSNYYATVINTQSPYMWWIGDLANAATVTAATSTPSAASAATSLSFAGGVDSSSETAATTAVQNAWSKFADADKYTVNALICGTAQDSTIPTYVLSMIAATRKDCIAFVSPRRADVVGVAAGQASNIIAFRNQLPSTNYGFMDSGYKYMYDAYNSQYIYVPLNGDVAGLYAALDDPWLSPAGLNRGNIKGAIKLAYSPSSTDRDLLYQASVNPVVSFPGQGIVLYGDKTLTSKPSAFSRINVRSLFITIERSIAVAAKYQLFELNNAQTQAAFVNMVTPFLRAVQGRQGLDSFKVVCDDTNNTDQVKQSNQFVGSVLIKPLYSINFISLTFTAVSGTVSFSENQSGQ